MATLFRNSARKLYLSDGAATPTYAHIPTISIDESPEVKEEKFFDTSGVSASGVAFKDGVITGHAKTFTVETKLYSTTAATPALVTALSTIKGLRDLAGSGPEKTFVLVEPDGAMVSMVCAVTDIVLIKGKTEDSGGLTFKLTRRGAPGTFSGTLT